MKNPFRLPTPIELGKSERNALPWNQTIGNPDGEYSWDDYKKEMKAKYPFRYWLNRTASTWFAVKKRQFIEEPIYWVKSFLIRKDHLLDLRGTHYEDVLGPYKWGYIDPCSVIEMATCKAFLNYVKELKAYHGSIDGAIEFMGRNIKDETEAYEGDKDWLQHYKTVKEIFEFFTVTYPNEVKKLNNLLGDHTSNYYDMEKELNDQVTEYLIKIIKTRKFCWL